MKQWHNALNRVTYGVRSDELEQVQSLGWKAWVAEQLSPGEDPACEGQLLSLTYAMEHGKNDRVSSFSLERYWESSATLVDRVFNKDEPEELELRRPAIETAIATWYRALHSRQQVREMLIEFWHNHFNASADADDEIALLFGVYDREVMRHHALGNFREFLEAVAQSTAMLYSLDNVWSKASPANENYARELFELHTLGAMHYYNHLYADWSEVPKDDNGVALGYIDEDVYEAARAFTGWTVANGEEWEDDIFPRTGDFYYHDQWHDHYQKRVLGVPFASHQEALADGRKVLDLLAYHPGTARHLCTKLCRWWVSDNPPESVVQKAMATWQATAQAPDQIARTVETILLSEEFEAHLHQKVKRPNHLLFSVIRQLDLDIAPSIEWNWLLEKMGYRQFSWPTPTGHPDRSDYWITTDMLLKRWNSITSLVWLEIDEHEKLPLTAAAERLNDRKLSTILEEWGRLLLGENFSEAARSAIRSEVMKDLAWLPNEDWDRLREEDPEYLEHKLLQVVSWMALLPEFQKR